jgi:DNA-binding NtrC family response regulator
MPRDAASLRDPASKQAASFPITDLQTMLSPTLDTIRPEELKRLREQLRFSPDTGHIRLFDQRMLLMHGFSMSELRRELIERLGQHTARGMFTRLGYQQGLEDHRGIRETLDGSPETVVRVGPQLRQTQGYVQHTPLSVDVSLARAEFFGDFTWTDAWEAEAHLRHFGRSGCPVCWMGVGYASAMATAALGKPVLAREVECVAMGHPQCRAVMNTLDGWGAEADDDLQFFQVEDFVDLPRTQRPKRTLPAGMPVLPEPPVSPLRGELVGASSGFNSVVYLLKRVGQADATVLFLGESGVGKERFSRALHQISRRAGGPFVSVNCAAIPHDLVEAELFGVERGAYTGATASRPGRFERAHGGTLFLDEVGSLSLQAQGKLLRALQEREIERVGGTDVLKVDVRVVAATNDDLRAAVAAGRFRADLFYRLNVFPVRIPPLRERREDIPLLLNVFLQRYGQRIGKTVPGVTQAALDALWHYPWPGNVRELENMVERGVILVDDGDPLDVHHLFSGGERAGCASLGLSHTGALVDRDTPAPGLDDGPDPAARQLVHQLLDQGHTMEALEKAVLACALERHEGKMAAAARALGLGRGQMQYRVRKMRGEAEGEPDDAGSDA